MRLIQPLKFFRIAAHVGMIDLGQLFVRRLYFGHIPIGEKFLHLELKELHGGSFALGKSRTQSFVGFYGLRSHAFIVILVEKTERGVAFGVFVVDNAVPLVA